MIELVTTALGLAALVLGWWLTPGKREERREKTRQRHRQEIANRNATALSRRIDRLLEKSRRAKRKQGRLP